MHSAPDDDAPLTTEEQAAWEAQGRRLKQEYGTVEPDSEDSE